MEATQNSEDDSTNVSGFEHLFLGCVKELDTKPKHDRPCDVTLVVGDARKQFRAHKNVLTEASPFFEKLFSSDMKERNEEVIRLGIVSESVMRDVLKFVYTGSVQILAPPHAGELIRAADYLLLSNLKKYAGRFLTKTVCVSNCISYLHFAEKYRCEELVDFTMDFIYANFPAVAKSKEFLNLSSEEVERWIASDDINVSAEEEVFEIICRWIKQNKGERISKFDELFRHVRLIYMSRDYLSKKVKKKTLVKRSQQCLTSLTSAISWLDCARKPVELPKPPSIRKSLEKHVIVIAGKTTMCYLPDTDTWYELPKSPLSPSRYPVIASRKNKVDRFRHTGCSECVRYDPLRNAWIGIRTPKMSRIPCSNNRVIIAVTAIDEDIYATLSSCCERGSVEEVWKYSQNSGSWRSITLPFSAPCVAFEDKYVYAMGGFTGARAQALSVRLNTVVNEREELAPMQTARWGASGVAAHGKIFVLGGFIPFEPISSCEVYNIETNEWHFIASSILYSHIHGDYTWDSVLCHGTKLYLVGKQGDQVLECYDIERNTWNTIPIPVAVHFDRPPSREVNRISACSVRIPKRTLDSFRRLKIDR